jgi:DNA polymerase-3 subunit gamma/tau
MSYQVLARKWRPRAFAQMVGQEHVLRALINGLDSDRLHHAYLFTGTRGVGKTTIARIIARCLNCERGVGSQPCGECGTCREIDEGRFVDLIEVDAASRTKVEDTRELLDNVQYAPSRGRYKVYLIDEIHMLSGHSFNALLKTLEEPPPHVKFLLATTDPQKIPVTILSRCLQFSLKRLSPALIASHLKFILESEGIAAEPPALAELARAADGSMRDALSLLDQAIAFGGGSVKDAEVRSMLGTIEREYLFDALDALAAQDGAAVLAVVARMAERSPDFADALADLLALLHNLALEQTVPGALGEDVPGRERLAALGERLGREDVQLFYQIALTGRRDLPLAPDPRSGFEMVLLRMLAFRPQAPGQAPRGEGERSVAVRPAPQQSAPRQAAPAPSAPRPQAVEPPPPSRASGAAPEDVADWPALVRQLGLGGMAQALAMHCEWGGAEADKVRLRLDAGHAHLRSELVEQRIMKALSDHFGRPLRLEFEAGTPAGATPAVLAEREREQRRQSAIESIENDPNVAAMRERFGAEVVPGSIEPLK